MNRTEKLAVAARRWRAWPSERRLTMMSQVARERMQADLPPPGPDQVEIEVAKMFPEDT